MKSRKVINLYSEVTLSKQTRQNYDIIVAASESPENAVSVDSARRLYVLAYLLIW